jgi:hypothetical protein
MFLPNQAAQMETCFFLNDTEGGRGYWFSAKNQYLGLTFVYKGETHYGWARLTTGYGKKLCEFKALLTGYAYESEPNTPILTGQTADDSDETGDNSSGSLGALAQGAGPKQK